MKTTILIIVLPIMAASCGKSRSGSSTSSPGVNPQSRNPVECISLDKTGSVEEIAVNAHKARFECAMSEEEIIANIK